MNEDDLQIQRSSKSLNLSSAPGLMARSWGDKCHELSRRNPDQLRTNRNSETTTVRVSWAFFFLQNFSRWLLSAFREYFSFSLILWHKTYHVGRKLNCKLFDPMRSRLPCASKMEGAFSFFISKRDILCFSHLCVRSKALTIRYFFRYYSSGEVHVRRNMSQIFQWLSY